MLFHQMEMKLNSVVAEPRHASQRKGLQLWGVWCDFGLGARVLRRLRGGDQRGTKRLHAAAGYVDDTPFWGPFGVPKYTIKSI